MLYTCICHYSFIGACVRWLLQCFKPLTGCTPFSWTKAGYGVCAWLELFWKYVCVSLCHFFHMSKQFVSKAACIINEGFVNVALHFQEAKLYAEAAISNLS